MFNEIKKEIINIKTSQKIIKGFANTMFVVFSLIALILIYKGNLNAKWALLGGGCFLFGNIYPDRFIGVYRIWMGVAIILGNIISRLILAILFYCLFMPIGLCLKIFKINPLEMKIDKSAGSYWIRKDNIVNEVKRYEKPY